MYYGGRVGRYENIRHNRPTCQCESLVMKSVARILRRVCRQVVRLFRTCRQTNFATRQRDALVLVPLNNSDINLIGEHVA